MKTVTVTAKMEIPAAATSSRRQQQRPVRDSDQHGTLTAHGTALFSGHSDLVHDMHAHRTTSGVPTSQNQWLGNQSSSHAIHRSTADDRALEETVIRSCTS